MGLNISNTNKKVIEIARKHVEELFDKKEIEAFVVWQRYKYLLMRRGCPLQDFLTYVLRGNIKQSQE